MDVKQVVSKKLEEFFRSLQGGSDLLGYNWSNVRIAYHGGIFKVRWAILSSEFSKHKARGDFTCINPFCHGTNRTQVRLILIEGVDIERLNLWQQGVNV